MRRSRPAPPRHDDVTVLRRRGIGLRTKIALAAGAAALALALLAAVGPLLVPSSSCRAWIEGRLARRLDAHVQIGRARFRLLPTPGYTIEDLLITSKAFPFQGLPLFTARQVRGALSLWPLVSSGRIVADAKLSGAVIDLHVAGSGSNLSTALGLAGGGEADAPSAGIPGEPLWKDPSFIISSLRIDDASSLRVSDNGALSWTVEDLEGLVRRLPSPAGVDIPADLRASGRIVAAPGVSSVATSPGVDWKADAGLILNVSRQEIGVRDFRALVAGSQFAAEGTVRWGAGPVSFDVHAASPALDPRSAASLLAVLGKWFPADLSWQGPLAIDVKAAGAGEGIDATFEIDGTVAQIAWGELFTKGAGLPFRASASATLTPQAVLFQGKSLTLGQASFSGSGQLLRSADWPLKVEMRGQGCDGNTLRLFLPKLAIADALEDGNVAVAAEGSLSGGAPMRVAVSITARRLAVAGLEISDVEASFVREVPSSHISAAPATTGASSGGGAVGAVPAGTFSERISIPSFKGAFAGGGLSGNGSLALGRETELIFDAVVDRFDAGALPSAGEIFSGPSSLVVQAKSHGADGSALARNLQLSGSLVAGSGVWKSPGIASRFFTPELWSSIEKATKIKLGPTGEIQLAAAGEAFSGLRAAFEMSGEELTLSDVSWIQGPFQARFAGKIGADKKLTGDGAVWVGAPASGQLIQQLQARKILLDGEGRLAIPAILSGTLPSVEFKVDQARLVAALGERAAAGSVKGAKMEASSLPSGIEKGMKPSAGGAPMAKREAAPAPKAEAGKPAAPAGDAAKKSGARPRRSAAPTDEQVESILKVIIGQ